MNYFGTFFNAGTGGSQTVNVDMSAASMIRGMLTIMVAASDSTGAQARSINNTGGQNWTQIYNVNQNNAGQTIWWCTFNGTWSANPVIDFGASSPTVTAQTIEIQVMFPTSYRYEWKLETLTTSSTTGSTTCTIPGVTTVADRTLILATWATSDQNTWGTPSATWAVPGAPEYGASGSGLSSTYAFKILLSPGATGDVSKTQLTLGPDNCLQHMIVFIESYKSQILN